MYVPVSPRSDTGHAGPRRHMYIPKKHTKTHRYIHVYRMKIHVLHVYIHVRLWGEGYLLFYLLKAYNPVYRTGSSHQGFSLHQIIHKLNTLQHKTCTTTDSFCSSIGHRPGGPKRFIPAKLVRYPTDYIH